VVIISGILIIGMTLAIQGAGWILEELYLVFGESPPLLIWPGVSWINAAAVWLLALPLAVLTRRPQLRAIRRTWTLAALFLVALSLTRLVPATQTLAAVLVQLILTLALSAALLRAVRRQGRRLRTGAGSLAPALAIAPALALPWVLLGALGSPIDTLLNILAGLSLGVFAGLLLEAHLFRELSEHSASGAQALVLGAVGGAVALAILGGGFGFGGSQLLLLAALTPLGLGAAGLGLRDASPGTPALRAWAPIAVLVGVAAAAPLAFYDPDELTLLLAENDVLGWAANASALAALGGLVGGGVLWLVARRRPVPSWGRRPIVGAPWLAVLAAYFVAGQPGFYGERLFVILQDQVDVSQALEGLAREERAELVYRTMSQHAETSQRSLREDLDRFGISYRPYYLVNGLEVEGGPLIRLWLSTRPEVDRVLDSPQLRPLPRPVAPVTGEAGAPDAPEWNVAAIGADRVWTDFGVTGAGITVAILDSGVEGGHPALSAGYRGLGGEHDFNWLDPWYLTDGPADIGGHGTHVAGSVLGRGGIGVAPDADWFACVNLARNLGNPALYLDCMQFALAPYPQAGDPFTDGDTSRAAHITNNSWGCPPIEGCDPASLEPAVVALRAAGIFVAAAAGNQGPSCGSVSDPIAIYPAAFTVGAVDRAGNVAEFSSRGPVTAGEELWMKPDVLAPGVEVLSSFPNGSYRRESGTSMASPQVAGVVALMWSAQPRLIGDIERTERILIETARPYGGDRLGCFVGETPNAAYGYGVVDAYAAVSVALALE
jgi:hypothetical protein